MNISANIQEGRDEIGSLNKMRNLFNDGRLVDENLHHVWQLNERRNKRREAAIKVKSVCLEESKLI